MSVPQSVATICGRFDTPRRHNPEFGILDVLLIRLPQHTTTCSVWRSVAPSGPDVVQ
jgi:hypothetical protein